NTGPDPIRGGDYETAMPLPSTPDLGTWQVTFSINGLEMARDSFTVSAAGAAAARVDQGGTFIANTRTTPIDGGPYNQSASATALSFTVTNFGTAPMSLTAPTIPAGWTVTDPLVSSLAAGASDTLALKLDTSAPGYRYGFVSFGTNDPNAPTYSFALE